MKTIFSMILLGLIGLNPSLAQKKTDNNKVRLQIQTEENGESINIDTVFASKADAEAFLKSRGLNKSDVPEPPAPPTPPAPPAPPSPPSSKPRKSSRITADARPDEEKVIIKRYSVSGTDNKDSAEFEFAFDFKDMDKEINREIKKVMACTLPDFEMDFSFDDEEARKVMILRKQEKPENSYRLEFQLDEPGTAKITVQNKDGKMLYEESLEGAVGNYQRDFDLEKYAGATLQLNVQSGKSKQTRKMIL